MLNQLRDLRLKKKLSQLDVAIKIGKDDMFISNVENSKVELKITEAAKLAYIYDVNLDDIFLASQNKTNFNK